MAKRYQGGLVPKLSAEDVMAYCEKIAPGRQPRLVKVEPQPHAEIDYCHENVKRALAQFPGSKRVSGWLVWYYPDAFIEAIYHSVIELPNGELLDVTPHQDGEKLVFFLPDSSLDATYDPNKAIPARRKSITADTDISQFIALKAEYEKIWCEIEANTEVSSSVESKLSHINDEATKTFRRWEERYMSPKNVEYREQRERQRREKAAKKRKK